MITASLLFAIGAAVGTAHVGLETDISPDSLESQRRGWIKGKRADPSSPLELVVALSLPKTGVDELIRVHGAVSDPTDAAYSNHLSNDDVHSLVAPSPAAIAAVRAHLNSHGIVTATAATPNSDMLVAHTTVRNAEAAFSCEYFEYTHGGEAGLNTHGGEAGLSVLRTPRYALPPAVSDAVAFVSPTVRLPSTVSPRAKVLQTSSASPGGVPNGLLGNTPKSLRSLYNVGDVVGKASHNKQAVTGFLGQHFSQVDLNEFHLLFDKRNRGQKLGLKGDDPKGLLSGVEAMLDAEYMPALGANISSEFWGFKGWVSPAEPTTLPRAHTQAQRSCVSLPLNGSRFALA